MYKLTVPGQPVPFKRTRGSGKRRFNDAKYTAYKDAVGYAANVACAGFKPIGGDCHMELTFRRKNKRRVDIDNLCKSIMDALQGIVYEDDKQVTGLAATVEYQCDEPGVDIEVTW